MAAIGGSILEASINGRIFAVTADSDATVKLGGFENEVMANGNGTNRQTKTTVPSSISGLTISIDDDAGDHEFLQQVADSSEFVSTLITYVSGASYGGSMQITGEITFSTQNATASINMMGDKLTKQ